MFCYEFLNGVFDNFLFGGSKVFVDFGVKSRFRKLANCFLLVEVGAPNDCRAAFVGCFDDKVVSRFILRFMGAVHSSLESLVLQLDIIINIILACEQHGGIF